MSTLQNNPQCVEEGINVPIYDYQCAECGHSLEAIQKLSDPVLTDCPACGKAELKKQVSAPSFRLSGGGWYETDFKTGNKKNLAGDASSGGDGSTGAAKTETKTTEPKTATKKSENSSAA